MIAKVKASVAAAAAGKRKEKVKPHHSYNDVHRRHQESILYQNVDPYSQFTATINSFYHHGS